ncbi:MAG: hypothetical protein NC300_06875 [Bacteroidales bacterium]|nr:hypothetical protein [Clostridium sp.]MCM1203850.1 hypothetical protein [Bacteroidales bacterium]
MKKHFKAVELKHLDKETIMEIREWRNQPFVKNMMYSQHDITEEEHKDYIASLLKDENRGLFVFYLDDIPFGIYQYTVHPEGDFVTDGNYLIDQEYQDMGYGAIQVYFMNVIKFDYLCCHKSYGEVLDINHRVGMLSKKTGGILEGVLRQHRLIKGEYHDVYCYGLLKSEWEGRKNKLEQLVYSFVDREYQIHI